MSQTVEPGRYKLINAAPPRKALDLDNSDKVSIVGWDIGNGDNQLWDVSFTPGRGYRFRNVRNGTWITYLRSYDYLVNGLPLAATPSDEQRTFWNVIPAPNLHGAFELHVNVFNKDAVVDLSNNGNGLPTILYESGAHSSNQQWYFEKH